MNAIVMIDYRRSLAERRELRKHCGPYTWHPAKPGTGRGFYQDSKKLAVDKLGSTFRLRLELANTHLQGSRLRYADGYYCDKHHDDTMTPIIARLPRSRGFLPGWTMGSGMLACLDGVIFDTPGDAARSAHDLAERDAERERDRDDAGLDDAKRKA